MPESMSIERRRVMAVLGAEIVLTEAAMFDSAANSMILSLQIAGVPCGYDILGSSVGTTTPLVGMESIKIIVSPSMAEIQSLSCFEKYFSIDQLGAIH